MPKVTSFINYKGGVGKTTIAVEVAASLAYRFHNKVLLVDLDPQTNATFYLIPFAQWENWAKTNGSLKDLVDSYLLRVTDDELIAATDKALVKNLGLLISAPGCLHLLPSHLELLDVDLDIADFFGTRSIDGLRILSAILNPIIENYDYVILDCPPNLGLMTQNGMMVSDSILIIAMPDYLSTIGISVLKTAVDKFKQRVNERLKTLRMTFPGPDIKGIVFNRVRYRTGGTSREERIMSQIEGEYSDLVFRPPARVSFSDKIAEHSENHIPIAISGYVADRDYEVQMRAVADEFRKRV